ncbi:unnamed protein product, partial [Phaeothamnion confervicola]
FPVIFGFEDQGTVNVLVMDLLGRSLQDLMQRMSASYSLKTTLLLALAVIERMRCMHDRGALHRDIKPANFVLGAEDGSRTVYCIDLGLAKVWRDAEGRHLPAGRHSSLVGTAEYASLNNHEGQELSRRDDLEAVGYMLLHFLKGTLPWMNLYGEDVKEKNGKIHDKKRKMALEDLCKGCPDEILTYMKYTRHLQYEEAPNYDYLMSLFSALYDRRELDKRIAWYWD